ncbi:MAG: hypothetical protein HY013_17925, partial [Candidatus Solibacter usitatus]|nr:hypothetical protein [Candidatus Solibacter usitatus]
MELQQTAAKLRVGKGTNLPSRDASPLLTVFKHQLRDWIASQLPPAGDLGKFEAGPLNASLKEAGQFGPECSQQDYQSGKCDAENRSVNMKVSRPQGYPNALLIQTGVGILCG